MAEGPSEPAEKRYGVVANFNNVIVCGGLNKNAPLNRNCDQVQGTYTCTLEPNGGAGNQ